jgi:hypothetical protein
MNILNSIWQISTAYATSTPTPHMNASDSLTIVTATIGSLQENFVAILPVLLPVVIVVTVLFFAWRKVHGLAKGK